MTTVDRCFFVRRLNRNRMDLFRMIGVMLVYLIFSILLCSCQKVPNTQLNRVFYIGTHNLYLNCIGEGQVTVVIDTGFGDSSERWEDFQKELASFAYVCTYDRAGYGGSGNGPFPRDSYQVAHELEMLLEQAGVQKPYLLVGHSLGGINMQVFAHQYPERTAGLILLDPAPIPFIQGEVFPELYQMLQAQTAELETTAQEVGHATDPEALTAAMFLETLASESACLTAESAEQVAAIDSFGNLPLIVIGSGQPNPAFGEQAAAYQQYWIEENQKLSEKSLNGQFILVEESSHYLHEDAPDVVLDAILQMVTKLD